MKDAERDVLLGRIDERTRNIYILTEAQEAHLSKLNATLLHHAEQIATNKNSIKLQWKFISGFFTIFGGIIALALKILGVY